MVFISHSLWIISSATVLGHFLLVRKVCYLMQWLENVNYRSALFAPFLRGSAAIALLLEIAG